jgi:hypothetical protein
MNGINFSFLSINPISFSKASILMFGFYCQIFRM